MATILTGHQEKTYREKMERLEAFENLGWSPEKLQELIDWYEEPAPEVLVG